MLFDDTYLTIQNKAEGQFRDRGSRFLAYAYPLQGEDDIKGIIAQLKSEHPKAAHYCWAMRLGPDRSVFRINDDGEPSGTGGRPILNVLLAKNLTNIIVVVVRYFGGTLLGVPGLINAYKTAAAEALPAAVIIEKMLKDVYQVSFGYLQTDQLMRLVKDEQLDILQQQFDNRCTLMVAIRKTRVNQVLNKLADINGVTAAFMRTV